MKSSDHELIEQLSGEERAERWGRADEFVLNKEHLDIICNSMFADDDEGNRKLGKILRDLVAFNTGSDLTALIDHIDPQDRQDISARRLLQKDALVYQDHWLLTSIHGTQNRQGKTKDRSSQDQDASTQADADGHPTLGDVIEYTKTCLGGVSDAQREQIARQWHKHMTERHWLDDQGDPIKEWRKVFEPYSRQAWLKKATNSIL